MKRVLSTRHGFFALAAIVCWATLLVIEPEFRWVSITVGALYAVLSILFFIEHVTRGRRSLARPNGAGAPAPRTRPDSS
jgi:hypothetical protein